MVQLEIMIFRLILRRILYLWYWISLRMTKQHPKKNAPYLVVGLTPKKYMADPQGDI